MRAVIVVGVLVRTVGILAVLLFAPFGFDADPDTRHGAAILATLALGVALFGRWLAAFGRRRRAALTRDSGDIYAQLRR